MRSKQRKVSMVRRQSWWTTFSSSREKTWSSTKSVQSWATSRIIIINLECVLHFSQYTDLERNKLNMHSYMSIFAKRFIDCFWENTLRVYSMYQLLLGGFLNIICRNPSRRRLQQRPAILWRGLCWRASLVLLTRRLTLALDHYVTLYSVFFPC